MYGEVRENAHPDKGAHRDSKSELGSSDNVNPWPVQILWAAGVALTLQIS
jgi:hypothetical protein